MFIYLFKCKAKTHVHQKTIDGIGKKRLQMIQYLQTNIYKCEFLRQLY